MAKKEDSKQNYLVLPCPQHPEHEVGTNGATPGNTAWMVNGTTYIPGQVVALTDAQANGKGGEADPEGLIALGVVEATRAEPTPETATPAPLPIQGVGNAENTKPRE